MITKKQLGMILLVILTSSIYVMIPDSVRIDIQPTKSIFKVYENNSWVISGTEYVNIFDGTKKMRAKSRQVTQEVNGNYISLYRDAYYKDNISIHETYMFLTNSSDVTLFPVFHKINVKNGEGKLLQYEVTDLLYDGETIKDITSPQSFGHQMKVEWQDGNYYSKIYKYIGRSKGKLTIKYRINESDANYKVRLFDPPIEEFTSESFFAEITDYKVGLTNGHAEFTFMNPLSKDIELNESTFTSLFNVMKGEVTSSKYSYDVVSDEKTIKEDQETCIDNFTNITVIEYNNVTEQNDSIEQEINTPICTIEKVDVIVPAKISKKDMGLVIVSKYEQITLRIDLEYEPNTIVEWIPQFEVDGIKFKGDKL